MTIASYSARRTKYPSGEIPCGLPGVDSGEGDDDPGQEVIVLAQGGGKCLGVGFGFCEEADSIQGVVLYCRWSDKDRLLISAGKFCCQRIRTGAVLECTDLHFKDGAAWRRRNGAGRDGGRGDGTRGGRARRDGGTRSGGHRDVVARVPVPFAAVTRT